MHHFSHPTFVAGLDGEFRVQGLFQCDVLSGARGRMGLQYCRRGDLKQRALTAAGSGSHRHR
jgi:hypothetical protein